MVAILALSFLFIGFYVIEIGRLIFGFSKMKPFANKVIDMKSGFSLVIPFRNEAENLPRLLQSISELNYQKDSFELIFIDDDSTDDSERIITRWRMENGQIPTTVIPNIQITASPKKNAILRAVPIAIHQWIITTDADCALPKNWLETYNAFAKTNNVNMMIGGVNMKSKRSFLSYFQRLDFLSLQSVTVGSFGNQQPFMCNGANFAYKKEFFQQLDGFSGNSHLASGDDVFLLQKAAEIAPEKIGYVMNSEILVETTTEKSWIKLFWQRVRWASKTTSYQSIYAESLAQIVFLANLTILVTGILCALGEISWIVFGILFLSKWLIDFILLQLGNRYFGSFKIVFPIFTALLYPIFTFLVAITSLFRRYSWKGRKFKA